MGRNGKRTADFDTDVAIVGSGFGGSVAALRLTEKGHKVWVLEKGKRWNPEDFPKTKSKCKLHFSFSVSNDRAKCTRLIKLINEARYPWLEFESVEYSNSNYENTYPISFAEGIRYIFNK